MNRREFLKHTSQAAAVMAAVAHGTLAAAAQLEGAKPHPAICRPDTSSILPAHFRDPDMLQCMICEPQPRTAF